MMKKLLLKLINRLGYRLVKIQRNTNANSVSNMSGGLERLCKLGIISELVIDIGAAKGSWTALAMKFWPKAKFFLIEPLKEQIDCIPANILENTSLKIIEGVAGETEGTITFNVSDDLDGSGIYGLGEHQREVKVYALDNILKGNQGAVLLKLDTHGYDIPIFDGAMDTLKKTEAIFVEVYGFYVSPHGKLFHEISAYLFEKGFRLFDIVDMARRKKDTAFWQADAIYLRADHSIFSDNNYR